MTDLFDLTLQVAEKVCQTYQGEATGGSGTTLVDSALAGIYPDDHFNGGTLWLQSGVYARQYVIITDYTGATGTFTFKTLSGLASGDDYRIGHDGVSGTGDGGGSTTTLIDSDIAGIYPDDFWNGFLMVMSGGSLSNPATVTVTDFDGATGTFTFAACGGDASTANYVIDPVSIDSELTGGSATTAVDGTLAGLYPNDFFNGETIIFDTGLHAGETAVVTDYTGASGTFTFASLGADAGDQYTAARINFTLGQLIQAVNAGLRAMGPWLTQDTSLVTVADQEQYTLPIVCQDVRRVQVGEETTDPYAWAIHYWWRTYRGSLIFDNQVPDESGLPIRMYYMADLTALDSSDDQVPVDMPVERLVWESVLAAFRLRNRVIGGDDPNLMRDLAEAQKQVDMLRYRYPTPSLPRDAHLANV